jgi:hypothetical protein
MAKRRSEETEEQQIPLQQNTERTTDRRKKEKEEQRQTKLERNRERNAKSRWHELKGKKKECRLEKLRETWTRKQ